MTCDCRSISSLGSPRLRGLQRDSLKKTGLCQDMFGYRAFPRHACCRSPFQRRQPANGRGTLAPSPITLGDESGQGVEGWLGESRERLMNVAVLLQALVTQSWRLPAALICFQGFTLPSIVERKDFNRAQIDDKAAGSRFQHLFLYLWSRSLTHASFRVGRKHR